MAQIIWIEPALFDLKEIAEYIALDKVEAAHRLVNRVFESVDQLKQFPEVGWEPPELDDLTYRQIILNPCRIFYRLGQDKLYILHVMQSKR
jgi:toxin ParE1/3/4